MEFELLPQDLTPYRAGNTGIDYVHRFESGKPGPHVLVNALTHGNELCGMVAARHLLDSGVRPKVGTLTVSFANVAAYESFDRDKPFASRQLVENLNRIWSRELLDGLGDSPELRRARELRPVVAAADHVMDLHSTSRKAEPFWVYTTAGTSAEVALAIGSPTLHMTYAPGALGTGVALIEYEAGRHPHGARVVVECGQHFERASGEVAKRVSLAFLAHFGLIDAVPAAERAPARRYEVITTPVVRTPGFRFARDVDSFEVFGAGELIATDGADELRSPEDGCTIFMPTREPIVGREVGWLTRRVP